MKTGYNKSLKDHMWKDVQNQLPITFWVIQQMSLNPFYANQVINPFLDSIMSIMVKGRNFSQSRNPFTLIVSLE